MEGVESVPSSLGKLPKLELMNTKSREVEIKKQAFNVS